MEVLVNYRFVYLIYKTILLDFGVVEINEIFKELPPRADNKEALTRKEFFSLLYGNALSEIPFIYLKQLLENVENLLRKRKIRPTDFMKSLLENRSQVYLVSSAKEVLKAIEPYIQNAFQADDIRDFILDMANVIHNMNVSGNSLVLLDKKTEGTISKGILGLTYDMNNPTRYAYDVMAWKAPMIQESPRSLGGDPFDTMELLADCRTAEMLPGDLVIETRDERLFVCGKEVGIAMHFSHFVSTVLGIDQIPECDDREGYFITEDLYSELGEQLLKKDSFLGAPLYLLSVTYERIGNPGSRLLKRIINAESGDITEDTLRFDELHRVYMDSCDQELEVTFCHREHKIYINGRYFLRSTPAKMLYFFLKEEEKRGDLSYQYQELKGNSFLNFDPFKPNIDVRVKRLREKLQQQYPAMVIEPVRKGEFHFKTAFPVALKEINADTGN